MSVLKNKRSESSLQFIETAKEIFIETVQFVSRLSKRYDKILASGVTNTAYGILNNVIIGNKMFPNGEYFKARRREHFIKAEGFLDSLDIQLFIVYQILIKNPQGCFVVHDKPISSGEAIKKLENMSKKLGTLIEKEKALLIKLKKSDEKRK